MLPKWGANSELLFGRNSPSKHKYMLTFNGGGVIVRHQVGSSQI